MKCVASNKDISRRKLEEFGREQACKKVGIFLNYALADKCGYSDIQIGRIHTSINKAIEDVESGRLSVGGIKKFLEEKYNAVIFLGENRQAPPGMKKDFVSGVYSFMDRFNIILIYVLLEKYGMKGEKVNAIMEYISNSAECCNLGYATEEEIEQVILNEDKVSLRQIRGMSCGR